MIVEKEAEDFNDLTQKKSFKGYRGGKKEWQMGWEENSIEST